MMILRRFAKEVHTLKNCVELSGREHSDTYVSQRRKDSEVESESDLELKIKNRIPLMRSLRVGCQARH